MNEQLPGYQAKAFECRNLVIFFLIVFGWTWIWWWVLFLSDWVAVPAGIGTRASEVELGGGAGALILFLVALSPFGPTIGGFVLTWLNEGRAGVKSLWKHFWNLQISWKWLLVIVLWWPFLRLVTNLVGRLVNG